MKIQKSAVEEISRLHGEIVGDARITLKKAIRIGELLSAEKERHKHGEWGKWIDENLPFTSRMAQNYIRCFDNKAKLKCETVSLLGVGAAVKKLANPKPKNAKSATVTDLKPVEIESKVEPQPKPVSVFKPNPQQWRPTVMPAGKPTVIPLATVRQWFMSRFEREKKAGNALHWQTAEYMLREYQTQISSL